MADSVNSIFCPFVQLLISFLPVKAFLQSLEHFSTGKLQILSLRLKVDGAICIGYFLIYYVFRFQVT